MSCLLKGTLAWDFSVLVFCTFWTHIGQLMRLLNFSIFNFVLKFEFGGLHVNWVNVEWDSTSTESTRNDKIFINVGVFCVDSVDMESHSALTQLTWSLILHWLSWRRVWLCIDSVWKRWIKPKQAYKTSSGAIKGIGFRKINDEIFKWSQCQPENVNSFYIAWSNKLTLR